MYEKILKEAIGLKTALALTLILAVILALYNFPIFLYSTIPKLNLVRKLKEPIFIHGSTLFISDLHLRDDSNREFYGKIGLFVEENNVSTIVIVGDWFDSPKSISYSDYGELFSKALDKMDLLNRNITIFFILGTPAHDPKIPLGTYSIGNTAKIHVLGSIGMFRMDNLTIIAYHGDHFSRVGGIAFFILYSLNIKEPFFEVLWREAANINEEYWVISGHTHLPRINYEYKVANCGGWVKIPYFQTPLGSGILVRGSEVFLVKIV